MKKQLLPFIVVMLLSLTSCGDGDYIKCKKVEISSRTYESSEATITFVFSYKAEGINSKQEGVYGEKNDTIYLIYRCDQKTADNGISVPRTGVFSYGTSDLSEASLTYESDMGRYSSSQTVYYSPSKRTIKYESASNMPIKSNKSKELEGKTLFVFSQSTNDKGDIVLSANISASRSNYYFPFQSTTSVTYIDMGTNTVAYIPY